MSEFNLLEEKWLKVLDGTEVKEVTLYDLFENAHNYNALAGELPTQDFAVLRFLLAVMYGSFCRNIETVRDAKNLWKNIYNSKQFDIEQIKLYLNKYKNRFYLFDDEFPFYQFSKIPEGIEKDVKKKEEMKTGVSNLNGELFESKNKANIFSTLGGDGKNKLSKSEAARWLIHLISYDVASKGPTSKTQYKYDGKLPWTAYLGGVYIEGENLFETLIKNFVTYDYLYGEIWELSKAPWEESKEILNSLGREIGKPQDPIAILTLQSRKVKLLLGENNFVNKLYIMGGDYFNDKEDVFCEQMTVWKEKVKTIKKLVPEPCNFNKSLWRGLNSLIIESNERTLPGVIHWIQDLTVKKLIPDELIKLSTVSTSYKSTMRSSINEIFSDNVKFNPCILTLENEGKIWAERICDELSRTVQIVEAYGELAENLTIASGDYEKKSAKKREISRAYYALEMEFRVWLENISPEDNIETKTLEWFNKSIEIIEKVKKEFINRCNVQLFKERIIKVKNKEFKYNAYESILTFSSQIKKIRKER
jgi:CRISPR system Cascade subunit CasA